jgi:DNA-binding NarL/FixJ family response regulator
MPDVVLMDLRMPVMDGADATSRIVAQSDAPQVLVLTTYDTDADIVRAVEAGARGYLLKDAPTAVLADAIRRAARGETVLAPPVAARLADRLRAPSRPELTRARARRAAPGGHRAVERRHRPGAVHR